MAELVDAGLGDVLDHREGSRCVAVQSGVADGRLAFVAGGENQPAIGVGPGHQQHASDPGLQVLVGQADRLTLRCDGQHLTKRPVGLFDGQCEVIEPLTRHQVLGVGHRVFAGVAGRHQYGMHPIRTQSVGGDSGYQRRVHPAGQTEADVAEAALVDVVTGSQHQGFVELAHLVEGGQRRNHQEVRSVDWIRHVDHRKSVRRSGHLVDVDVEADDRLFEPGPAPDDATCRVGHHRPAVEHKLVLAPHQVHVGHRPSRPGRGSRHHRLPGRLLAPVVGRSVDGGHHLGPTGHQSLDWATGHP